MNVELIEHIRDVVEYDKVSGDFTWKTRAPNTFKTLWYSKCWNTRYAGKKAGVIGNNGRVVLNFGKKKILGHRAAWALTYGTWPLQEIDHIDCNPINNGIANLRVCTRLQNQRNLKLSSMNSTGFKGVTWIEEKQKFKAQIKVNEKCIYLGLFDAPEKAHQAYCTAANQIYGEFANHGN